MAEELEFDDLIYEDGDEIEVFELSYATFAEELQLQEILEGSMIASERTTSEQSSISSSLSSSLLPSPIVSTPEAISSPASGPSLEELETDFTFKTEKELEDAVCEAIKKSECPVCHRLSCTKFTISPDSGLNCHEQLSIDRSSALGCNEQRRKTDRDEKRRQHIMARELRGTRSTRHYQSRFNGRSMADIPQTSSSEFRAKRSSRVEDVHIACTGNTQDRKGKGIAIEDDWLLVSKKKLDNRFGNSAANPWCSKDNNRNVILEEDDNSLDDEDDLDSDTSQKSHESRKKSRWFKEFFERINALSIEEIDETPWHCPACQGGPSAIKWYRSIQDLISHAKKIGTSRAKLHRELAELLEGELRSKGNSMAPPDDQIFGNWKGLNEDSRDHEIVWPPMVVIMNTMSNIYKDGKCLGMGKRLLLDQFSSYPALKAQHSYGPQGHRGLSVLIFESSAVGYLEAERLHKSFIEQGLDRVAWNSCPNVVLPGGDRQLYGFMALKEDLDIFNQHCQGKSKIKYELKPYRETILNEIVKMSEDSQQLIWLKGRLEAETRRAKTLEASANNLTRNLQQKMKDIQVFEQRVQLLRQQNIEEMDSQENFYKEQIKVLEARVEKLEKLQESDANPVLAGEPSTAMGDLVDDEQTPYQYNTNLSIDED